MAGNFKKFDQELLKVLKDILEEQEKCQKFPTPTRHHLMMFLAKFFVKFLVLLLGEVKE